MRKIRKGYEVELLIFKIFLKHVKLANMYPTVRGSLNIANRNRDLFYAIRQNVDKNYVNTLGRLASIKPLFINCQDINSLLDTMRYSNGGKFNIECTAECQMKLMNNVNALVHSCLEYSIHDNFGMLEKIGGDVFNEVCTKLFGEGFEDKTSEMMGGKEGMMLPPPEMRERMGRNPEFDKAFMEWLKMMKSQRIGIDMETEGMPQNRIWQTPPPPPNDNWYQPYGIGDWEFEDDSDWNS